MPFAPVREELPGARLDEDKRLPVRGRVDAVDVESRALHVVAPERHRGDRRGRAGTAARAERQPIQRGSLRVGEPRRPFRDHDVVDEGGAARRELVRRDGRTRLRVVDERVAGPTAGHEQPAAIDLHADRRRTCRRGDELCALAGPEASSIHLSCRDRAHVELIARDRDALGLEPVRQLDAVREWSARRRPRSPRRRWQPAQEVLGSFGIPSFRRTCHEVLTPLPPLADCDSWVRLSCCDGDHRRSQSAGADARG